ncbi:MAG: hydrogenase iron-sulfur subunit [Thermodesulfobacteriota bacterium]
MSPTPARAVLLCRGGRPRGQGVEFRRLRWAMEADSAFGPVIEVSQACHPEGAAEAARQAAALGLELGLVGACPQAAGAGPLAAALAQAGLAAGELFHADLYDRAPSGQPCQTRADALEVLAMALAEAAGREPAASRELEVSPDALVVGQGLMALRAAQGLARQGRAVTLLAPTRRLAPPEPLLGPEAAQEAAELAKVIEADPALEVMAGGELLGLMGTAGDFTARLLDRQGRAHVRRVGAVILAQGPPQAPNLGPLAGLASDRLVRLEELIALLDAPEHLRRLVGDAPPRVGFLLGLGGQASPAATRAALHAAARVAGELNGRALILTSQTKLAAPDLEALTQTVKGLGAPIIKLTRPGEPGALSLTASAGGLLLTFHEEILDLALSEELDLAAVDGLPAPDRAWREFAARLGLAADAEGFLQPDRVAALPSLTSRAGVFALGPARGRAADPSAWPAELGQTLLAVTALLGRGRVSAPTAVPQIDRRRCAICLTCVRVCPRGAMTKRDRRPYPNPLACTACGTCAAECPMDAISPPGGEDARHARQAAAGLPAPDPLAAAAPEPSLLVLACANSAGRALDAARLEGKAWPAAARLVRVPCAGRVDPEWVLGALGRGYHGVLVMACWPDACYSLEGNAWAAWRMLHLGRLLMEAGLEPERAGLAHVSPVAPSQVIQAVEEALAGLERLGPSPLVAQARVREVLSRFTLQVNEYFTIVV